VRNVWRVLAFDFAAPLAAIAALLLIGYALEWRVWWVAVCAVLCTLIVEGMAVNLFLFRRDRVTVGTDDDGPGLRLSVVALSTTALVAAVIVTYTQWTRPDQERESSMEEVVRVSSAFSEALMTFSPEDPMASVNRAAELMDPERGARFKADTEKDVKEQAAKKVAIQGQTISAGVEGITSEAASVAVLLSRTRNEPNQPQQRTVFAFRIVLAKKDGEWRVLGFDIVNPRPPQPAQ
jgi:hypothetical protein